MIERAWTVESDTGYSSTQSATQYVLELEEAGAAFDGCSKARTIDENEFLDKASSPKTERTNIGVMKNVGVPGTEMRSRVQLYLHK